MQKFRVVAPLDHDGSPYVAGDDVELSASDADRLTASGVVEPMPEEKQSASVKAKKVQKERADTDDEADSEGD